VELGAGGLAVEGGLGKFEVSFGGADFLFAQQAEALLGG
jgi:hypothetical protein